MKQNITVEQLEELKKPQYEKLREWIIDHINYYLDWDGQYLLPPISIGEMIEFLEEEPGLDIWIEKIGKWRIEQDHGSIHHYSEKSTNEHKELCDALWEAVKEVLNA